MELKKVDWFGDIAERLKDCPKETVWSNGSEILCRTECAADMLADMLESLYEAQGEDVLVKTGYYDPEEDKRSGEEDQCTGWWYVDID